MDLTLVVMAAGLGSRFGGTKQLASVGPSGEAILDYTLYDARRAGFERVVLIIRTDLEDAVREHLARQQPGDIDVVFVHQDTFGPPRDKPWGTAHAILAVADQVTTPFVVANADDFYGRQAYVALADELANDDRGGGGFSLVGYRLDNTLSPRGSVSRGVCEVDEEGLLTSLVENLAIERQDDGRIVSADSGSELAADTRVSMNLWGLQPAIFERLRAEWDRFHTTNAHEPKAEFLLPSVIGEMTAAGEASVRVLATDANWLGVTYPGDLDDARSEVAALIAGGEYSTPLR